MFSANTYKSRREILAKNISSGICLFIGHKEVPMNATANTYHFRQDSSFLYYFGLDKSDLNAAVDADSGESILFGDERSVEEAVWMGDELPLKKSAGAVGVEKVTPSSEFKDYVEKIIKSGRKIHILPQYNLESKLTLSLVTGIFIAQIDKYYSSEFIDAVVKQRSIKTDEEISEIEKALDISYEMYEASMSRTKPGLYEREICGMVNGIASAKGAGNSFTTILSVHGEILHNHHYDNLMEDGDLVLMDSGAESTMRYASDITRTFPVNGKFTTKQKDIYNIVLNSQIAAIDMIKNGVKYKDVHLKSSKVLAEGLTSVGLMKGNPSDAVEAGAHALFFPHGLGHMLGLDVHDMEALGENFVGYDKTTERSSQFGLGYLRLAKELKTGFVLTVEPGIYFIPQLFEKWKTENKHREFIDYDKFNDYLDFGGIRIEDDILVTDTGSKILGKPIPKTVEEVESACTK
jgi:Xaa-Pro aminopeptidase